MPSKAPYPSRVWPLIGWKTIWIWFPTFRNVKNWLLPLLVPEEFILILPSLAFSPLLENGYQRVRFKITIKLTKLPIPVIFNTFTNDEIIQSRLRIDPVYYPGSFGSCYFRICVLSNKRHCCSNGSRRWCSYDVASCRWWNNPKQSFDPAPSRHSRHSNRYVSSCQIRSTSFRDKFLNSFTVRPTMTETTALGAAMAAVNAEGIDVWSLDSLDRKRHHQRYIHSGCFWIRYI